MQEKMYDIIAVLGYAFDKNGELPVHVPIRLEKVASLFHAGISKTIVLCGRWSISHERNGILHKMTEAEKMQQILQKHNIPHHAIIREEESKDTIANAYFLKTKIVQPHGRKRILISCADYHLTRVQMVFSKIFGPEYQLDYLSTETKEILDSNFMQEQGTILQDQVSFLAPMESGDHTYLEQKNYFQTYFLK